jgi:hypothetical protein
MGIPYAFIKALEGKPASLERDNRSPENQMKFLMEDNNMKGQYLGACLDSCRWGVATTVMWETDVRGLMALIEEWRKQNDDNPSLYHERRIEDIYAKFELPHIKHEKCPASKEHEGTIKDVAGRVRCSQERLQLFRPSFIEAHGIGFNELAQMKEFYFGENEPFNPMLIPDNSEERNDEYWEAKKLWDSEEQSVEVKDVCYAILNDSALILPFERVLDRLNLSSHVERNYCQPRRGSDEEPCRRLNDLDEVERHFAQIHERCPGHVEQVKRAEFPFDGWTMAFYLQKWKEQSPDGKAPWLAPKLEDWESKKRSLRNGYHSINAECAD